MSKQVLTHRQADVLAAIADLIEANGYQPTYEQIGKRIGLSSTATIFKHISNLQQKGYISRSKNVHGDMKFARRKPKCCPTCGHRKTA